MKSCRVSLLSFLKKKRLSITADGEIYSSKHYLFRIYFITTIMLLLTLKHILYQIPYFNVTVTGHTLFSDVIGSCLLEHNISSIFLKEDKIQSFVPNIEEINKETTFPTIVLLNKELNKLSKHTNIDYLTLTKVQDHLYKNAKNKLSEIIYREDIITKIIKVTKDVYYVTTNNTSWFTRLVITDKIPTLCCSNIIMELVIKQESPENNNEEIIHQQNSCILLHEHLKSTLTYHNKYFVDENLDVLPLNHKQDDFLSTNFFTLLKPKKFGLRDNILTVHPFCFTKSYDPFFLIRLVTLSYILSIC